MIRSEVQIAPFLLKIQQNKKLAVFIKLGARLEYICLE